MKTTPEQRAEWRKNVQARLAVGITREVPMVQAARDMLDDMDELLVEVERLRGALRFYADPNNTIRECMAQGSCANCDLCKRAQTTLGLDERGRELATPSPPPAHP